MRAPAPEVRRVAGSAFDWATGTGGAAELRRIREAATAADGRDPLNEAAELLLHHHGLDGSALFLADDPLAGFAFVHGLPGPGPAEIELVVSPGHRRRGTGTRLATGVLGALPDRHLVAWSHGDHPAAARLAARTGFAATRELWVMRRDLGEEMPQAEPTRTAGAPAVVVRGFRLGADEDELLRVNAAAFAHHPEQGELSRAGLEERFAQPWFDPEGLLVAEADGRLLGFHWTKTHPGPDGPGEVYVIGVDPEAQGLGLGLVLLSAGLGHLRDRGLRRVQLYVEAANPAVRMYQRLGFTHAPGDTDVQYTRRP